MKKKRRKTNKGNAESAQLPYRDFGKLLRRLRLKMGMSQVDLAEHLDLHPSYLSRLEHGERRPSPQVLKMLSEITGYGLENLLVACRLTEESGADKETAYERMVSLRNEVDELRRRLGRIAQGEVAKGAGRGPRPEVRAVPVYDVARAGMLLPATKRKAKALKTVSFPASVLRGHEDAFVFEVKDDGMVDAGILQGDRVVISPKAKVKSGDTALTAQRRKKPSLKTVFFEDGRVILHAANRNYQPVSRSYPRDVKIIGKAILVWRKMG